MPPSMPLSLVLAWILLLGFINTHQRHARNFGGASQAVLVALTVSTGIGTLVVVGLLIFYVSHVAWYWAPVLFLVASIGAGLGLGVLGSLIGDVALLLVGFVAWPAAAVWAYTIIRDMEP